MSTNLHGLTGKNDKANGFISVRPIFEFAGWNGTVNSRELFQFIGRSMDYFFKTTLWVLRLMSGIGPLA